MKPVMSAPSWVSPALGKHLLFTRVLSTGGTHSIILITTSLFWPKMSQFNKSGGCEDTKKMDSLMFGNLLFPSSSGQCSVSQRMTPGSPVVTEDLRSSLLSAYRGTRWRNWWLIGSPCASIDMGLLGNSTSQETNRQVLSAQMCFMGQMSNTIPVALTPGGFIIRVL